MKNRTKTFLNFLLFGLAVPAALNLGIPLAKSFNYLILSDHYLRNRLFSPQLFLEIFYNILYAVILFFSFAYGLKAGKRRFQTQTLLAGTVVSLITGFIYIRGFFPATLTALPVGFTLCTITTVCYLLPFGLRKKEK